MERYSRGGLLLFDLSTIYLLHAEPNHEVRDEMMVFGNWFPAEPDDQQNKPFIRSNHRRLLYHYLFAAPNFIPYLVVPCHLLKKWPVRKLLNILRIFLLVIEIFFLTWQRAKQNMYKKNPTCTVNIWVKPIFWYLITRDRWYSLETGPTPTS